MTQPEETGSTGSRTFTQTEVDAIVRDRLARDRTKYADYDELRVKAAEADKSASQLDKMQQKLDQMASRAEASERDALVREVADELKITVKQARRLSGKTRDELLADGREFLADFQPKAAEKKTGGDTEDGTEDSESNDQQDTSGSTSTTGTGKQDTGAAQRGRPREDLRSGAPMSKGKAPEETDPLKLAALVPRR